VEPEFLRTTEGNEGVVAEEADRNIARDAEGWADRGEECGGGIAALAALPTGGGGRESRGL